MRNAVVLLCLLVLTLTGCNRQPPEYISRYTPPVSAPPPPPAPPVAIIGDVYTSGSALGEYGAQRWPELAVDQLNQQGLEIDVKVGAQDGSGYVAIGHDHTRVFADRIPELLGPNTKAVVVFGSANDMDTPAEELTPAVQQALAAAKTAAPSAALLVIGPAWVDTYRPQQLLTVRDIVQSEAAAVGATFVDPIAEAWFTDQPDLLGTNGTTPTEAGHAYLAAKIAPLIAQQLQAPAPELAAAPR